MGFCRSCKRQSHTMHIFTRIALRDVPSLCLLARLACDVYQAPKHTPKKSMPTPVASRRRVHRCWLNNSSRGRAHDVSAALTDSDVSYVRNIPTITRRLGLDSCHKRNIVSPCQTGRIYARVPIFHIQLRKKIIKNETDCL